MADPIGTVLITGGLGYLGRRMTDHLRQAGWLVLPLSRSPSADVQARCFHGDWATEGKSLLAGVDQVVHLACPDEKQAAADPVRTTQESFAFTHGLLREAAKAGVQHVILASTIHVYGRAMQGHVSEETLPRPLHPYGIIKRLMEDQVAAACASGPLSATILRLANGFGAPVNRDITRWSLIINDLCRQAMETGRLELKSDPRLLRNFITIEDVCVAVRHCLTHPADVDSRLLNIGSSRSHSLGEMARLVAERCAHVLGRTPELHASARQDATIPFLDYDLSRMHACGIVLKEDFVGEIDRTLAACARWFAPAT